MPFISIFFHQKFNQQSAARGRHAPAPAVLSLSESVSTRFTLANVNVIFAFELSSTLRTTRSCSRSTLETDAN